MWCSEATEGTEVVFHFALWLRALVIALPLAVALGALVVMVWQKRAWVRIAVAVVALPLLMCGGCLSPSIAADRVRVGDTGVEQTTGFWFSPTRKGFEWVDVVRVDIHPRPGGALWHLHPRAGAPRAFDPGDLWDECAQEIIVDRLRRRGVEVRTL